MKTGRRLVEHVQRPAPLRALRRFNGNRDVSDISIPANLTDNASGFSRLPLQTGQPELDRNWAARRFIIALWVAA
jgi:hypothetical protein